jgi:proteasome lid subunit RPN8/RPN11
MERVVLADHLIEQMTAQALASPQTETCGLLSATGGRAIRCIPITNVAQRPQCCFSMEPGRLIDAFREMRKRGEELYAIYHSHPGGPAQPSPTDLEQAAYPEALYLVIALHDAEPPELRAYRIRNGAIQPVELITDTADDGSA